MSRIREAFATAHGEGRAAFIPFLVAGDPAPEATLPLCEALDRAGADILEIGVPFSDPLADGPVIQRASERALSRGASLAGALEAAREARRRVRAAIVLFSYYNPIFRMGEDRFARAAAQAGVDGVLVTDLPLEEGHALRAALAEQGVDAILLVAPTSTEERIAAAASQGSGFIYFVSRTGTTGAREGLPPGLAAQVAAVRRAASLPVAVGFGISTPQQVRAVGEIADGVVVGSALVAVVEAGAADPATLPQALEREARRLRGTA